MVKVSETLQRFLSPRQTNLDFAEFFKCFPITWFFVFWTDKYLISFSQWFIMNFGLLISLSLSCNGRTLVPPKLVPSEPPREWGRPDTVHCPEPRISRPRRVLVVIKMNYSAFMYNEERHLYTWCKNPNLISEISKLRHKHIRIWEEKLIGSPTKAKKLLVNKIVTFGCP